MSKAAHELESLGPPDEPSSPELTLVESQAPEGAFFISEALQDPDMLRLRKIAESAKGGDQLLLATLEELGLTDNEETVSEHLEQANKLLTKVAPNSSDIRLIEHLQDLLNPRIALERAIGDAYQLYQVNYLRPAKPPATGRIPNDDMLEDLFRETSSYTHCSLLHTISEIQKTASSKRGQQNTIEADRIARILISNKAAA